MTAHNDPSNMKRQHSRRLQLTFAAILLIACLLLLEAERSIRSVQQRQDTFVVDTTVNSRRTQNKSTSQPYDNKEDDICRGYDGVLRIRSGDEGAAFGTVFFIYMVNHLLYAEKHNLLPWIHLDDTSHRIYDPDVHGTGPTRTFETLKGEIPSGEDYVPLDPEPAPLFKSRQVRRAMLEEEVVEGNGVWESYFEPVSAFSPARNMICKDKSKPLYELDIEQVATGLHSQIDWGVMAWPYKEISEEERNSMSLEQWYRPMRRRAATVVRRYFHPKPWVLEAVEQANPLRDGQQCLAMHVRTTDKELSGGRSEIELRDYLPYALKYLGIRRRKGVYTASNGNIIYLATDSESTLKTMKKKWPEEVMKQVRTQGTALRSKDETPTFDLASHHRTNKEVLIDILAMAKCEQMIHGRSAVSEAVMYLNADMREGSIDLDIPELE